MNRCIFSSILEAQSAFTEFKHILYTNDIHSDTIVKLNSTSYNTDNIIINIDGKSINILIQKYIQLIHVSRYDDSKIQYQSYPDIVEKIVLKIDKYIITQLQNNIILLIKQKLDDVYLNKHLEEDLDIILRKIIIQKSFNIKINDLCFNVSIDDDYLNISIIQSLSIISDDLERMSENYKKINKLIEQIQEFDYTPLWWADKQDLLDAIIELKAKNQITDEKLEQYVFDIFNITKKTPFIEEQLKIIKSMAETLRQTLYTKYLINVTKNKINSRYTTNRVNPTYKTLPINIINLRDNPIHNRTIPTGRPIYTDRPIYRDRIIPVDRPEDRIIPVDRNIPTDRHIPIYRTIHDMPISIDRHIHNRTIPVDRTIHVDRTIPRNRIIYKDIPIPIERTIPTDRPIPRNRIIPQKYTYSGI